MQKSLAALLMLCAVATFAADPTPKPWNSSIGAGVADQWQHRHEELQPVVRHEVRPEDEVHLQGRRPLSARRLQRRDARRQGLRGRPRRIRPLRAEPTGIWKTSDFADALYHFDAGLATKVTTRAELSLAYVYDYKNRTSAGVKKGDSSLLAALLFKF